VKGEVRIVVHDMTGREMYKQRLNNPAGNIRLFTSLSPGIYSVKITGADIQMTEKIMIMGRK
jgi:hypothetical protein